MTNKPLVIFHSLGPTGHCDDGFAAAMIASYAIGAGNVETCPAEYDKPPPDVAGRDVIMVDISYKRPVLEQMLNSCRSLLILDHHKTAQEELAFLPEALPTWEMWQQTLGGSGGWGSAGAIFDMERCGASLAWDFFRPGHRMPEFIQYIEDRDLWRNRLPGIDQFVRNLRSYPQDFDAWRELLLSPMAPLIQDGHSIERYFRTLVEQAKRTAYLATLPIPTCPKPVRIIIANCPKFAASEVAGELAGNDRVGATYFEKAPGAWEYSLRSRGENAIDVSAIAKAFGGGGHHKAAGFTAPCIIHKPI